MYLLTYIYTYFFFFSRSKIHKLCTWLCIYVFIYVALRRKKGRKARVKGRGTKNKKRGQVQYRGLGRAEFRVTKVISLFVRKVSSDGQRGERKGEREREGENRWKRGGNRSELERELRGLRWEGSRGRKGGRGYSDKAEGSAGCVEFLRIKGDFCNVTNCERKMAEKLRRVSREWKKTMPLWRYRGTN